MRIVSQAQLYNASNADTVVTACNIGVYDLNTFSFKQPWHGATEDYTITVSGGNSTYLWSNGDTTQQTSGLAAGTYTCTLTESSGCSVQTGRDV